MWGRSSIIRQVAANAKYFVITLADPRRRDFHHRLLEAIWLRILSVMLILLGVTLFASPHIRYSTREEIRNTPLSVKREPFKTDSSTQSCCRFGT